MKTPRCFFWRSLCVAAALTAVWPDAARARDAAFRDEPVLPGRVLRVTDGDTVRVSLPSGPVNVRLHAADAPEKRQEWGPEAKAALTRRLAGRQVDIVVTDQSDAYGRMVGRILLGGEDINAWMVRSGHAWVYRQYADRIDDAALCALEQEARNTRRGLWSLPPSRQVAPWEWRGNRRGRARAYTDWSRETAANCRANLRKTPGRMTPPGGLMAPAALAAARAAPEAPRPGCDIKGNISGNGRIYHLPGSSAYARTRIDTSKGERWFCSESEARAAGWRPPR